MSSLSTLPKGDSAWLLRKSIQRIMQQVSVLETNIGSSTTGNSANTQVIFNDNGTLRGDTGLTFNKTTDTLGTGRLTTSGDAIVCSSTGDFYVGTTLSPQFKVERATGSATITGDLTVKTNVLKVDTTNNRVGIGTATPASDLHIQAAGSASAELRLAAAGGRSYIIGSTGTGYGSANNLIIYDITGSAERYRLDSGGNHLWQNVGGVAGTAMTLNATGLGVGVGPSYKLHVFGASPALTIQDSSSAAGGVGGTINFIAYTSGTSGANIEAQIKGVKSSASSAGELLFFTSDSSGNSQQRFMVDGIGNVGIGVTPSAGKGCLQLSSGINFPATQVASSDANTLDDYEEGTWTGTLKGSVSDPTTPVTATGAYTKVGRLVHVTIAYSNVTTTGASGDVTITGLPFAGAATGAGSSITFDMFTTSTTLACWNVGTTIAFYVSGQFIPATHNAGASRNLNVTFSYYV